MRDDIDHSAGGGSADSSADDESPGGGSTAVSGRVGLVDGEPADNGPPDSKPADGGLAEGAANKPGPAEDVPEPRENGTAAPVATAPPLDQLRDYVTALVDVIATHPDPSLERDEAQWRIEELATELSVARPSAPRIRSRWIRLAPVLLEVRPDVPVPALNDLIEEAFTKVG